LLGSKGLREGPVENLFVYLRAIHCWLLLLLPLLLLLLLCRLLGKLTDHWLHGENDSCECLQVCFPQLEKQPSFTFLPYSITLWGCP